MDRLKATNSVPFANRDIAPATGTAQYATNGNPSAGVPATIWPAYAFNMVQDEIMACITGAGLTPDDTNWGQLWAALKVSVTSNNPGHALFPGGFILNFGNVTLAANTIQTISYEKAFSTVALVSASGVGSTATSGSISPANLNIRLSGADLTKMQIANPNGASVAYDWLVFGF